jgi:hypothetical protein
LCGTGFVRDRAGRPATALGDSTFRERYAWLLADRPDAGREIVAGARFGLWHAGCGLKVPQLFLGGLTGDALGGESGLKFVTGQFRMAPFRLRFAQRGFGIAKLPRQLLASMTFLRERRFRRRHTIYRGASWPVAAMLHHRPIAGARAAALGSGGKQA